MIRLGICGACGKMGKMITALAAKDKEFKIVSALEREGHESAGKDLRSATGIDIPGVKITTDLNAAFTGIDCMIDFTLPEPTLTHLKAAVSKKVAMVIGTTGLKAEDEKIISEAAKAIPIIFSPNMAPGVHLLFNIVAAAAKALGKDFSISVDETHHVHKKDSPSGTAKMIARVIKEASGKDVPVEAFREGEVVGNHGIIFKSEFETLEIRHDAKTREVFAAGSLKAAKYLAGKPAGLYRMADVLGLS
jgi:4-hydroxy-tetrahydrodipicolinate reductase